MNYYSVTIIYDEIVRIWRPDITITSYEARCYDTDVLTCKIKTEEICENGTPISEEEYFGECNG